MIIKAKNISHDYKRMKNAVELLLALFSIAFVLFLTISVSSAQETDDQDKESTFQIDDDLNISAEDAIQNILSIMKENTEIATSTKMNADFVPGMVTLLHGDELESKGIRTVFDAISTVPGLTISINSFGQKEVIIRGFGMGTTSSNVKLMLNNIPLNQALNGSNIPLFDISIEQVERIEIIRGPGSVLYGEYAYAGVINVITRSTGNRVFGRYGSYGTYEGGAIASYELPEKDLDLSLNLSYWDTAGADVNSGPDSFYGTENQDVSNAPGSTHEAYDSFSGIFTFNYNTFSLLGQMLSSNSGDYFGFQNTLSDNDEKVQSLKDSMLEARQKLKFTDLLEGKLKLGYVQSASDSTEEILPDGYIREIVLPVGPPLIIPYPEGLTDKIDYRERRIYGSPEFIWKGWSRQNLLIGFFFSDIEVLEASYEQNDEQVDWPVDDETRRFYSFYLQDEIELSDHLVFTPGLRYDNYDDFGERVTPRIAAVYRISDRNIVKAQYAEAFNAPTFTHVHGRGALISPNDSIEAETIQTYELGYILKGVRTEGRATLYYSKLKDLIAPEFSAETRQIQFENIGEAELKGIELEVDRRLFANLKTAGNITYLITEDDETGEEIEGSTNWLANFGLTYTPSRKYTINALYQYVGERYRAPEDDRDSLDGYNTFSFTLNLFDFVFNGMTLRFGINNIFDENVVFPSPQDTYPEDYPRGGREWWTQISYAF